MKFNPYKKYGGTWQLPNTRDKARELIDFVRNLESGNIEERPILNKLHNIFGDDALFDAIDDLYDDFFRKVATVLKDHLSDVVEEYRHDPEMFSEPFDFEALEVIEAEV